MSLDSSGVVGIGIQVLDKKRLNGITYEFLWTKRRKAVIF